MNKILIGLMLLASFSQVHADDSNSPTNNQENNKRDIARQKAAKFLSDFYKDYAKIKESGGLLALPTEGKTHENRFVPTALGVVKKK